MRHYRESVLMMRCVDRCYPDQADGDARVGAAPVLIRHITASLSNLLVYGENNARVTFLS